MTRRGNSEGSIFKRKDGRWASVVDLGWQDGKRKRKTYYGATRQEVASKLTAALRDQQQGKPIASERLTVGQYLNDWLVETLKSTVRPRTFQSYAELVRLHLVPGLGRIVLSKLGQQDVRRFINRKLNSSLSPRRVQYIHAVLRRALSDAVKDDLVSRNVAKLVASPKVTRIEIEPFNPVEAREFLHAIQGERLEALYLVAIATGLRQAEILGLSWKDIDLDGAELTVRTTLQRIDGEFQFVEPKTARSRRTVAMPVIVVDALRTHRGRQVGEMLQAGNNWVESGLVFTPPTGGPLADQSVRDQFYRILKNSNLRRQRFHDLRHSCASLLIAQGVSSREIMEQLGHSTITLTMNTYGHIFKEARREVADKMGQVLAG